MAEAEQFKSALLTLLADVFWQRVNKTDGCWLYTGIVDRWGYGAVIVFERRFKAHRVSWMLHYGDIPGDMRVCHKCDVTRCVRPDHLFLGTQAENLEDMGKKGATGRWRASWQIEAHRANRSTDSRCCFVRRGSIGSGERVFCEQQPRVWNRAWARMEAPRATCDSCSQELRIRATDALQVRP